MNETILDDLVIGAGQAGLAIAYYLRRQGRKFIVLDKGSQIGEAWRNRYDSLELFTPRWYSSLPGLPLQGTSQGYATKDEIAGYLQEYATAFELPVQLLTDVISLVKTSAGFQAETNRGIIYAKNVIVATGPFQKPNIPAMAASVPDHIVHLHSAHYRSPAQLQEGDTLVVGAGNSGAQIAVELAKSRNVTLSVGHPLKFMPLDLLGKSIFWWFQKAGVLRASKSTAAGRWLSKQPDPIFGKELQTLLKQGVVQLKPRAIEASRETIRFEDQSECRPHNIIWATGFYSDYKWLAIPEAFDRNGKPIHERGVSPVGGLYFLGLPWQHRRGSALIGGVGEDAKYLFEKLI